ncbi:ribbon-helix-helix protein, CopG family [Kribbella sp. NPDC051587]|uniref:ribbon-helix-helix protein, CopG family n=1 Tax=Kribbella sp. NPDC051587 TaxID=3364119 RepID=UPI0037AC44DF
MNLELDADLMAALHAEAARSGRSQREIVHEAVTRHLDLPDATPAPGLELHNGETSLALLDRDDRF